MTLLDPKNTDVADLLGLLRDIDDRIDELVDVDQLVEVRDEISGKIGALIATEPGHDRAVLLAVGAVIEDMADRRSLIPVGDDDSEYDPRCNGCLLKKNGYPRLAELYGGTADEHGED
jgi:hypothetical protein